MDWTSYHGPKNKQQCAFIHVLGITNYLPIILLFNDITLKTLFYTKHLVLSYFIDAVSIISYDIYIYNI